MIAVIIQKSTAENMRRNAMENAQKLALEITRHKNQFPGYLQDKDYIRLLETRLEESTEFINAVCLALKKPIPAVLPENIGGEKL